MVDVLEMVKFGELFEILAKSLARSAIRRAAWQDPIKRSNYLTAFALRDYEQFRESCKRGGLNAISSLLKWRKEHPEHEKLVQEIAVQAMADWRELYPEEAKANVERMRIALDNWKMENPEKDAARILKGLTALAHWRKGKTGEEIAKGILTWQAEHPDEVLTRAYEVLIPAGKKWREENPEKTAEQLSEGRKIGIPAMLNWQKENPKRAKENAIIGSKAAAKVKLEAFNLNYLQRFNAIKVFISEAGAGVRVYQLKKEFPQWSRDTITTVLKRAVREGEIIRIDHRYYLPEKEEARKAA
jgi:hypothetical protein